MKTKEEVLKKMNSMKLPFLEDMGGSMTDVDLENHVAVMHFDISKRYCHSVDVIQGGFVTAMLDSVSSHAVFACVPNAIGVSTLELKVTFYKASRSGKIKAVGRIDKVGRTIAFMSGDLYNEAGERTASITQTAKISYKKV